MLFLRVDFVQIVNMQLIRMDWQTLSDVSALTDSHGVLQLVSVFVQVEVSSLVKSVRIVLQPFFPVEHWRQTVLLAATLKDFRPKAWDVFRALLKLGLIFQ
jgi:hypothetical protein